ncbi:hypothetical protein EDE05_102181 [Neorhizobium sp. R1-B]|nr:hypothetical protein EDE05_102181 [Neorhizobium sp. R1-B]
MSPFLSLSSWLPPQSESPASWCPNGMKGNCGQREPSNTKLLALAHTAFYFAAFAEGWVRGAEFDAVSRSGLVIFVRQC